MNNLNITARIKKENKARLETVFTYLCLHLNLQNVTLEICSSDTISDNGVAYNATSAQVCNARNIEDTIASMAHELRHCFQYNRGWLVDMTWKGTDHSKTPYATRPWEQDAREFEFRIAGRYR